MGLSICRSIIDAHGGRLWAEANEPRGAVFQFTLPSAERTRELSSGGPISAAPMLVPIRSSFACGARDLPGDHLPRLRYSAWHSARRLFGVDLRGFFALKDGVRAGFNDVRGTVHLQSTAPLAELAKLKEVVDAHCPVLDILRAPVPVDLKLETQRAVHAA